MQRISLFAESHRQSFSPCACQHSIEARAGLEPSIYLSATAQTSAVDSVAFVLKACLGPLPGPIESLSAPV